MGWKLEKTVKNWALWADARTRFVTDVRNRDWIQSGHSFINMLKEGIASHAYGLAHVVGYAIAAAVLYAVYKLVRLFV